MLWLDTWSEVGEEDMCERTGYHPDEAIKSEKQSLSIEQVVFLCQYSFSSILSTFRASLNILLRWIELHLRSEWMEIKLLHNAWAALPSTWQSGKCCISNHIMFLKVRQSSQSEKRKWEKGEEQERRKEGEKSRVSYIGSKIIDTLKTSYYFSSSSRRLSAVLLLKLLCPL